MSYNLAFRLSVYHLATGLQAWKCLYWLHPVDKLVTVTERPGMAIEMMKRLIFTLGLLLILPGLIACSGSNNSNNKQQRVGYEILEIQSLSSIRAWINRDGITQEEFDALELPPGWFKNQPRESSECGPDSGRFLKSPDATMPGEILEEELFGYNWFHSATVIETNVPVDEDGLLRGTIVRKFHELTYNKGSCLILLISPEEDVYFRIGRAADRTSDVPTIPNLWRLEEYETPEKLVIELFEQNLVIRTDNEDSFQGPVPELGALL